MAILLPVRQPFVTRNGQDSTNIKTRWWRHLPSRLERWPHCLPRPMNIAVESWRYWMLPLPAMNCVRAIHDASLRICSLVEPGISAEARLACSAADFLATVQGGIPLLRIFNESLGGRGDLQRGLKGRDGAVEHFIGVGLEVKLNGKGDALHVRCGGSVANINVKSTDLSLKYTPRHYAWGLNSGATHSSPWLMHGLSGPWSQMLVSMISPLLDISDALATNLLGYVGLPSDEVRRSTHTRRLLLVDRYGRDGRPFVHHETYHRGS
jgi:hypothetical protein